MIDRFGRKIDYVRISVTDRCNLRCCYCMPEEGVPMVDHEDILRYGEIVKLAEIFASLGIEKIKLTGGEPLVRKDLWQLTKKLKEIPGIRQVTLITNGILLKEQMRELAQAGIDGVNISLDTLREEEYYQISRRRELKRAWEGFQEALKYPEVTVKINCVPMGQDTESLLEIGALAKDYPVHVRFIEMMPIGLGKEWKGKTEKEIKELLENRFGRCRPLQGVLGNGPGHYISFEGFQAKIGFISAVSHKFCSSCNRIRLTSQGYLKSCLQYDIGEDLREPLRRGEPEEKIKALIVKAIEKKPEGHMFGLANKENQEQKIMSQIGG